jgi:predicted anti-sigma-YlaC factor YlaD
MNCKQSQMLIRTLPRPEWTAQQRDWIDEHVRQCAECRTLLDAEQQLDAELHSLFEPEPPSTVVPVVMARIARIPLQHASAPTPAVRVLSATSRWIGVTVALVAYLSALMQGESSTLTVSQLSTILQGGWAPSVASVSTIVFACGLLLYLFGLFAPLGRSHSKAHP